MNATNELKGYLGGFDLTDVFQLISQQQKTGILTVKSTAGEIALSFKNGQIVGMNPSMKNQEFDLGQMLRASEKISTSRFNNLRQEQIRRNIFLEQILVEHEIMSAEEIGSLNLLRIFEALACILRWKQGSYTFQPTAILHETPYLPIQQSDFVLFEILRQMDEFAVFEQQIPSLNTVYESVSTFAAETDDNLFSEDLKKRLPIEEQNVLELVNGNNTVQDIIDKSLLGHYNVYRILHSFLESGIIAQKDEKAAGSGKGSDFSQWDGMVTGILSLAFIIFIFLTITAFVSPLWRSKNIPGHTAKLSVSKKIISQYLKQKNEAYQKAKALLEP